MGFLKSLALAAAGIPPELSKYLDGGVTKTLKGLAMGAVMGGNNLFDPNVVPSIETGNFGDVYKANDFISGPTVPMAETEPGLMDSLRNAAQGAYNMTDRNKPRYF